ncbi:MAG: GyrI-like domain-containing protein [Bacteroidia bacterium]|nr:GyrI-like domain-containing protein [Bacteroidia bacterium]
MNIQPKIVELEAKKAVGMRINMSLANNRTAEVWRNFMPRKREIIGAKNNELMSLSVYEQPLEPGNFNQTFEKWAAVEVGEVTSVPENMEVLEIPAGLYAVFHYKGLNTNPEIFKYILGVWLPHSEYGLDLRPHFEVLGDLYKNNDPDSEEDIFIPIKPK